MKANKTEEKKALDKIRLLYAHTQGGIFSQKTRIRLITKEGLSGRGQPINTFWYRQRENVKTALIDLRLFIEESDESQVNQVMTAKNLRPLVETLLLRPIREKAKPDLNRAEIAELFINVGFQYLKETQRRYIRKDDASTINRALDEAFFLVDQFRPLDERKYVSPLDRPKQ